LKNRPIGIIDVTDAGIAGIPAVWCMEGGNAPFLQPA
jgi:hypothetical protein